MRIIKCLETYFLYFLLYSIFGWCYEVFLETVIYQWGFSNRGFLFGPYCPVYGFGALAFLLCLRRVRGCKRKLGPVPLAPFLIFLGSACIATVIELAASYIMEWTIGGWQWDYLSYDFNFQGRIALNPSVRFGIGGLLFLYVLQPLFEKLTGHLSDNTRHAAAGILFALFTVDFMLKIF